MGTLLPLATQPPGWGSQIASTYPKTHIETLFSTAQNRFWTYRFWCPSCFCFFVCLFYLFHIGKMFPSENFFHPRKQKEKSHWGQDWVNRRCGAWGHPFLVKNFRTISTVWVGVLISPPWLHGPMHWESSKKKFTEAECSLSQQHQLVYWCWWIPRKLT